MKTPNFVFDDLFPHDAICLFRLPATASQKIRKSYKESASFLGLEFNSIDKKKTGVRN